MSLQRLWPSAADETFIIKQSLMIADCYKHWTGRHLIPPGLSDEETAQAIFKAPFVVASTNHEAEPILNYGNRTALTLWELSWEAFTQTPGKHTAEAPEREQREKFLNQVKQHGFVNDYRGVRVTSTGKRFEIYRATVWNLLDENGMFSGQAVMFKEWTFL